MEYWITGNMKKLTASIKLLHKDDFTKRT